MNQIQIPTALRIYFQLNFIRLAQKVNSRFWKRKSKMPLGQNTDNRTMIWDYKLRIYSFQFKVTPSPGGANLLAIIIRIYRTIFNSGKLYFNTCSFTMILLGACHVDELPVFWFQIVKCISERSRRKDFQNTIHQSCHRKKALKISMLIC